jgi:hypothetical protein
LYDQFVLTPAVEVYLKLTVMPNAIYRDVTLILSILMVEAIHSTETSVRTRATLRHIPEDGILHSRFCENLISFMLMLTFLS